jgi:TPR repeat protein
MDWTSRSGLCLRVLIVLLLDMGAAARVEAAPPALQFRPPDMPGRMPGRRILLLTSDFGISIVRMPQSLPRDTSTPAVPAVQQAPAAPRPAEPPQPQGRLLRLPARLATQANDPQRAWLGVEMEALELPLALSLGLPNANGALLLKTISGGPADQAGIRTGDIVVGLNGRVIANISDLHQRIALLTPGSEALLEVWRATGDGEDFPAALRRLADGGNAHVMYHLGRMYAAGSGVARDDGEAARWYRRAADAGNVNGTAALGFALLEGRGTPIDQQEGLRLVRLAAANEHVEAANRLGHILLEGKIADKDALEAVRLFSKAAEAGHTPSMVDLGLTYANGNGVATDLDRAGIWYKRAADLGNSYGMVNLGWLYEWGKGVELDPGKAAMWYKRAADLGNSYGTMDLALLYAQGKGVQRDDVAAVALNRKAVSLGNALAMNNLAWMLQSGRGVAQREPEEAADLMMKSLDRRNEFSRQRLTQFSNTWSREFRQALQSRLRDRGYYSGPIDGRFRESTVTAINAYFGRPR